MASSALWQSPHLATPTPQVNFYPPENDRFYASQPYATLDPGRREIRLVQIHPNRIQGADLPQLFPHWNKPGNDFKSMTNQPPFLSGNPPKREGKVALDPPPPPGCYSTLPAGWARCQTQTRFDPRFSGGGSASKTRSLPPTPSLVTFYVNQYTGHTQWELPREKVPEAPPEFPNGFLACELVDKVSLGTANGRYVALSYAPGKLNNTRQIMVNGFLFNVFANLEHALECVRKHQTRESDEKFFIWADQICINQSNVEERSQQMQYMSEIFRNSGSVFACLSTVAANSTTGPPPPPPPELIPPLPGIGEMHGMHRRRRDRKRKSRASSTSSRDSRDSYDSGNSGEKVNSILASFARIWKLVSFSASKPPRKKTARTTTRTPLWIPPPPSLEGPPGPPGVIEYMPPYLMDQVPPPIGLPPPPPGIVPQFRSAPESFDHVLKRIGIGDASRLRDPEIIIQKLIEDLKSPSSDGRWAYEIDKIIRAPWWTGAWAYQEFILAARLFLVHHDKCWPWHIVSPFLHLFCHQERELAALQADLERDLQSAENLVAAEEDRPRSSVWQKKSKGDTDPSPSDKLVAQREAVWRISRVRRHIQRIDPSNRERVLHFVKSRESWAGPKALSSLLATAYLFRSTDPRETIYAFSGLADPSYKIVPDYHSPSGIFQVLVDTARKIVQTENSLVILDDAILLTKESYGFWLPSWVPNWGSKPRKDMLKCKEHMHQTLPTQSASPNRVADATFYTDEEYRANILMRIRGQRLGTIARIEQESEFLTVFSTSSDFVVETSPLARVGDQIWVLHGAKKIYILRKHLERQFSLIAEAFLFERYPEVISEYMIGKAIDLEEKGEVRAVEIDLV